MFPASILTQAMTSLNDSRWITKLKRTLIASNILHITTAISPLKFYSLALIIGVVLLCSSIAVGMATFFVDLEIETLNGEKIPRTLDLGYLTQMNYGIWYLIFCPVLLALVALAYDAMRKAQVRYPYMLPSFENLRKSHWIATIGILILSFFVLKNIVVEWGDYKNLSLGWVQARPLQEYRGEIERTKLPIDLVAKGKKFDRFLLVSQERFIQKEEIRSVKILRIDPNLNVRSFAGMLLFILITKLWVGLWESIVIYFAIMTLIWAFIGFRNMDLTSLKDSTGAFYHLSWVRRPAFYVFLVGILVNLFCVFRYVSNAAKGSYGKWDQYWSLLLFSPIFFLIPVGLVFSTIYNSTDNEQQAYLSKKVVAVAGLWFTSFAYVVYLILGYINPRHQAIIVACFKPFTSAFKQMLGF